MDQDYAITLSPSRSTSRTIASQSPQLPPKPNEPVQVMLGAAALAEEPLAAAWTFVHCVGHQQPLALELLAEDSRSRLACGWWRSR